MTRKEAIKILSDYESLSCGFCHCGGDEVPQAFEMAVKALEAWEKVIEDIKKKAPWDGSQVWVQDVLEIISKHLSEVEDEQTEC